MLIEKKNKKMEWDYDAIHKALSNRVRRQILLLLKNPKTVVRPKEFPLDMGISAGEIGSHCRLSQSTVSAHLSMLQAAGLITPCKVGQWIFYSRNDVCIQAFLTMLNAEL